MRRRQSINSTAGVHLLLGADARHLAAGFDWWRAIGFGALHELPEAIRNWTDAETIQALDDVVAWRGLWSAWATIIPQHTDQVLGKLIRTADAPLDGTATHICAFVAMRRIGFWGHPPPPELAETRDEEKSAKSPGDKCVYRH